MKHQFSSEFTSSVMAEVGRIDQRETKVIQMWYKRAVGIAAACFVACFITVYGMDGSINMDSVLGLSEYSDSEISQTEAVYNAWDSAYK